MKEFRALIPRSVQEALELLSKKKGAMLLAGGSDLVVKLKERKVTPRYIIDITHLKELKFIREDGECLLIGPLVTHSELSMSDLIDKYAPVLKEAVRCLGSPQIRNIGTIGGNIVTASPVADTVPPLFVLDATLTLRKKDGERRVHIRDFGVGPQKSIIEPTEMLTEIRVKKMGENEVGFYRKLGQRKALAISKVSVAFWAKMSDRVFEDVKIALGAVAPRVVYAQKAMEFLRGKPASVDVIKMASEVIKSDCTPITDIRSTEEYRREMTGALLIEGCERIFGMTIE